MSRLIRVNKNFASSNDVNILPTWREWVTHMERHMERVNSHIERVNYWSAYLQLGIKQRRKHSSSLLCARVHFTLQFFSDFQFFSVPFHTCLSSLGMYVCMYVCAGCYSTIIIIILLNTYIHTYIYISYLPAVCLSWLIFYFIHIYSLFTCSLCSSVPIIILYYIYVYIYIYIYIYNLFTCSLCSSVPIIVIALTVSRCFSPYTDAQSCIHVSNVSRS